MESKALEEVIINDTSTMYSLYKHTIQPRAVDYQKYIQHFIFVPPEVIKHTFEKATQFY